MREPTVTITLDARFTESPSFNLRIKHEGREIFYNSTRLQGSQRLPTLGKILCRSLIQAGVHEVEVTHEQLMAIIDLGYGKYSQLTGYRNIYFISESLNEPVFEDCVPANDVVAAISWLRHDAEIPEDSDDHYFSEPASIYF